MPEYLTDEQAALIWSGEGASLAPTEDTEKVDAPKEEEKKEPIVVDDAALSAIFSEEYEDDEEEEEELKTPAPGATQTGQPAGEVKKGRKPTDLLALVSQLVDEDVLKPFEDGEIKTIEDAKELIKLNLQSAKDDSEEEWWNSRLQNYSPQVRALLYYAEQGNSDIAPLMQAIAQVEESMELSLDTPKNQEEVVREMLKLKNFDDDEIDDQIATLKDLDKLKAKAEKFLPELNNMKQRRVQLMMQEQEKRQAEAREATTNYLAVIQQTLSKDNMKGIALRREDKSKIYESLANARYTSLNGVPTNGFVKTLEELQFGRNADYEQFLNIVHYTVDPEGFIEKLKTSLKNEVNAETVKKLKNSRTTNATTEEIHTSSGPNKKTVARDKFKNPFA